MRNNDIWLRIDCSVNFEVEAYAGMETVREKHFMGGSFRVGERLLEMISRQGGDDGSDDEEDLGRLRK